MGSGTDHDVCFRIDKNVDSVIEGNVTIQDSNLILDNTRLATDDIVVTPLNSIKADEPSSGIQLTTSPNWDAYKDSMIQEIEADEQFSDGDYNPYEEVDAAMCRTTANYESIDATVKSLTDPITYLMEKSDASIPRRFKVNQGVYRMDASGNAMFRNVTSEKGRFSELDAWKLRVNQLQTDKLVLTSVASNVVDTDNLLKSRGIAEFDGAVNVNADVFVGSDSKVNVASGTEVAFQSGSTLKIRPGANLEIGNETTVKMGGDIEIDVDRLVFLDSKTNRRFKIAFRDASGNEGCGVVVEYSEVPKSESRSTTEVIQTSSREADELVTKLRKLGI